MNQLFEEFNELINASTDATLTDAMRELKTKEAAIKAAELQGRFTGNLLRVTTKKAIRLIILMGEVFLGLWLNKVYQWRPRNGKRSRLNEELEMRLTQLIEFIREHFTGYFNIHQPMPLPMWEPVKAQLEKRWNELAASYEADTEAGLFPLIRSVLVNAQKKGSLTYHEADYWMNLMQVLPTEEPGVHGDTSTAITFTLIRRNFNSSIFVYFMLDRLGHDIDNAPTAIQHWTTYLRMIHRIPVLNLTGLDPDLTFTCKELVMQAIQQELLTCGPLVPQPLQLPDGNTASMEPLETDFTLSQLAVFARMLIESGILPTENQTDTLKKVSAFFSTRNQEKHSAESLRVKYYRLDPAAKKIVRERALLMINKLNSMD